MGKPFFSNIVVAISDSDASVHAAKYAIMMAKACKCRLTAVYVVDTASINELTRGNIFINDEAHEYEFELSGYGERYLAFVEDLAKAKGLKIGKKLAKGDIVSEILAAAAEVNADLIILGGWEKERRSRDIISRIHHDITVLSHNAVLVVKEPAADKQG